MPRKKKLITERETEDVIKRLFPKKVVDEAKQVAHEKEKPNQPTTKG